MSLDPRRWKADVQPLVLLVPRPGRHTRRLPAIYAACGSDHSLVLRRPLQFGGDLLQTIPVALQHTVDDAHRW